ncbi:sulfide dehydrogenase [Falsiroseomonas bella]|uniref:Sulfide dehydrogenase n=1 Tax=Falsiroseomonas bella TaxID=2184016 RepID=A0A317FHI7_9PROT|nr:cytochrome c [Falsiroseomonas bella]PWS38541.1 sulfide dehydrogenase [Falsiroseomonas bella]
MRSRSRCADLAAAASLAAAVLLLLAPASAKDAASGREVFTEAAAPACSICHALAAAGASGEIGPSLDALKPSADQVRRAVTEGPGNMPSYADSLSDAQIEAVAKFVAESAGG